MSGAVVIGISFDNMDAAKRKINKALDAANAELDDLSKAAGSLQVYDGRLVQKAGTLDSMRNRINGRINGLQQVNAHIDYVVRRFKETDELCAQRMRAETCEIKKTLGLARSGGIFGGIVGGLASIVIMAEAAWNWVNKDNKKNLYVPKVGFSKRGYIPGLGQAALIAGGTLNTGKFVIEGMKAVKGVSVDAKGTANLPPWGYNGAPPAGWTGPQTSNGKASTPSTEGMGNLPPWGYNGPPPLGWNSNTNSQGTGNGGPSVTIPEGKGTLISYMGYHKITDKSSPQYKLKENAQKDNRYSIKKPEYYALIDDRIVIATKPNIGGNFEVSIGDYLDVTFENNDGSVSTYKCILGDIKGDDAPNPWGHYDGKGVVEVIYNDYKPPEGYNANKNNPWGNGRVIGITKVGKYS